MKTNHFIISLIAFFCLFTFTGCSLLPSASKKNVEESQHPGGIYFSDDFSSPPNGWGTIGCDGGEVDFNYGGLIIKVSSPNSLYWTVNAGNYVNTTIDVDAVLLDGPINDNFGVVCRFVDNGNFYGFLVTHDGYFGVFKMIDGKMVLTGNKTNLDYSEVIRQGGVVNHITAECNESILKLTVNDALLSEIQDNSFSSGQIGLIAGAYGTAGVQVLFDNFKVTQP
jgi:hypothetical protein